MNSKTVYTILLVLAVLYLLPSFSIASILSGTISLPFILVIVGIVFLAIKYLIKSNQKPITMKINCLFFFLLVFTFKGTSQNCLDKEIQETISVTDSLFLTKMEGTYHKERENPYQVFLRNYASQNIPDSFFVLPQEQQFFSLNKALWIKRAEWESDFEVIPPVSVQEDRKKVEPENYLFAKQMEFLNCLSSITKHPLIKTYTRKVTFFGASPLSLVNASSFQDSLDLEDYQDIAIQRLIIMEVFLPKLVNYNRTANSED